MKKRGMKKQVVGTIISNKMDKTVVVMTERLTDAFKRYRRREGECEPLDPKRRDL